MSAIDAIVADFKSVPFLHQLREFEEHCNTRQRALLWQMRTGKTKAVIDKACHLAHNRGLEAVIVVAPNGVHLNWQERELGAHMWDSVPYCSLAWRTSVCGDNAARGKASAEYDKWWSALQDQCNDRGRLQWLFIASDTMTREDVRRAVKTVVRQRRCIMVVYDEAHDFRAPASRRTRMARALSTKCDYRMLLTGTPVENSPLSAYSQFELLQPAALGYGTYSAFMDRYAVFNKARSRAGAVYQKLDHYKNMTELRDSIAAWSSIVLRSDCHDLPDLVRTRRYVELSDEQRRVYVELQHDFIVLLENEEVSIGELSQRLIKLQQVLSGYIRDEFSCVHWLKGPLPRLLAAVEEVELSSGKVVVWCAFRPDMDRVSQELRSRGHKVLEYHGRVSEEDKARARAAFHPDAENDIKALVGYPTPGLNLSAAGKIIWYSHVHDAVDRTQADERATAMGGENVQVVDLCARNSVDSYILDNHDAKISVAHALSRRGPLIDMLRATA